MINLRPIVTVGIVVVGLIATALVTPVVTTCEAGQLLAQSGACQVSCRQQHSQCRIATKGAASCDAELHSCLQGCIRR